MRQLSLMFMKQTLTNVPVYRVWTEDLVSTESTVSPVDVQLDSLVFDVKQVPTIILYPPISFIFGEIEDKVKQYMMYGNKMIYGKTNMIQQSAAYSDIIQLMIMILWWFFFIWNFAFRQTAIEGGRSINPEPIQFIFAEGFCCFCCWQSIPWFFQKEELHISLRISHCVSFCNLHSNSGTSSQSNLEWIQTPILSELLSLFDPNFTFCTSVTILIPEFWLMADHGSNTFGECFKNYKMWTIIIDTYNRHNYVCQMRSLSWLNNLTSSSCTWRSCYVCGWPRQFRVCFRQTRVDRI